MAGQYAMPQNTPMTPGTPPVSPSSRAAHAILDQSVMEFAKKNFPQYISMIPEKYAKLSVREAYKSAGFLEKQMFSSKIAGVLPKGVTMADIDKAANEPSPPPEKPATPPPAAVAPAAAAPAAPAKQYALPPAAPKSAAAADQTLKAAVPATVPPPSAARQATADSTAATTLPPVKVTAPPVTGNVARAAAPSAGGAMGGKSTKGVNASLVAALNRVGANYGPYTVQVISGVRPGDSRQHGTGNAIDVQLIDKTTGKALPNYQNPKNVAAYQDFAHAVYNDARKNDPALADKLRWGGYFSGGKGKYGAFDLMHFDTANQSIGMAGGNFKTGFTPQSQKTWGIAALSPGAAGGAPAAAAAGPLSPVAGTPQPEVQAGAGPAAIAAARSAAAAGTGVGTAAAGQPGAPQVGGPAYFPKGTAPETVAAIQSLATKLGVSPAAIAGVIKTESGWNTGAASPGGTYRGLTQIGQTTFNEAGGKLGGLSYDQYLKATPAQQVAAYGDWLNHYQFGEKAQRAGVDFSKMSPAAQAAYLQGFQFGPNDRTWQMAYGKGDTSAPTTSSPQAGALGSTSLADMTKYYEKMLGKDATSGGLVDPTPDVGGGSAPAETGSGTPAPDSSGGGTGGGGTTPDASASPMAAAGGGGLFGGKGMEGIGDMFSGMGDIFGKGPVAQNAASKSGPANLPMASLPPPVGPVPMVDPRMIDSQRQQLAAAMQRLNSRRLF